MLTRRAWMAGMASLAAFSGIPGLRAAPHPPFPTDPRGRLSRPDLHAYARVMMSGGPGKDGIPAIDDPVFWTAAEADAYLDGGDVVFGLMADGFARAYPQRILVWHEIVNDTVAGRGLAVTYCPLTGTAIAFERAHTEFGVSGRLVNSNLVMYDRDTDTWFPQVLGVGIRGPHMGEALAEHPLVWTTWERWRAAFPATEVLSTRTGFARNYNHDPYGSYNPPRRYYRSDTPLLFPVMNEDRRFPNKTVVLGARTAMAAVAFRKDSLRAAKHLTLTVDGERYAAVYDPALDTGYIFRGATQAEPKVVGIGPDGVRWTGGKAPDALNAFEAMWFAWAAFYPQTAVHD